MKKRLTATVAAAVLLGLAGAGSAHADEALAPVSGHAQAVSHGLLGVKDLAALVTASMGLQINDWG
ncbi:hypothetical protein [Streptomyces sp. AK02-01A]|uniref:hypothetical protein n=1 Tax=Streptomyces sp. AK02-01A TaxID=3028648 RepID=UPI0029AC9562|nr:hypothetical protein [Streptomyces sp. AK02-01A]MDX3854074.1 hypothetical protein [Streptomyces sp. AK02-01A]